MFSHLHIIINLSIGCIGSVESSMTPKSDKDKITSYTARVTLTENLKIVEVELTAVPLEDDNEIPALLEV